MVLKCELIDSEIRPYTRNSIKLPLRREPFWTGSDSGCCSDTLERNENCIIKLLKHYCLQNRLDLTTV